MAVMRCSCCCGLDQQNKVKRKRCRGGRGRGGEAKYINPTTHTPPPINIHSLSFLPNQNSFPVKRKIQHCCCLGVVCSTPRPSFFHVKKEPSTKTQQDTKIYPFFLQLLLLHLHRRRISPLLILACLSSLSLGEYITERRGEIGSCA